MSRPRFLTAIAVSAAVCEGVEDQFAADNITPAYLVFEWLVVEAFVRAGKREATVRTPGTQKAQEVRDSGEAMCARNYLRTPTVFGFHGVYKPLARHLGIVDDDLRLADKGYELLKIWQGEQRLDGFVGSAAGNGPGKSMRQMLRWAVDDGLRQGYSKRVAGWQGWSLLAQHLAPADTGKNEAAFISRALDDAEAAPRGEVFNLLQDARDIERASEAEITRSVLLPKADKVLSPLLKTISAYERACAVLEEAFNWIRYQSTHSQARPITKQTFAQEPRARHLAHDLSMQLREAEEALSIAPLNVQQLFAQLSKGFDQVRDADSLFEAVLNRHAEVQAAKPPEGKRSWFERSPDGATMVRVPYRVIDRPRGAQDWNRPYRIFTVRSFLQDLNAAMHEPT